MLPFGLTPREMQTVRLLCDGLTNAEIAKKMKISEWTVRRGHLSSIFDKMGQSNRLGVAMLAVKSGLVTIKAPDLTAQRLVVLEERLGQIEHALAGTRKLLDELKERQL